MRQLPIWMDPARCSPRARPAAPEHQRLQLVPRKQEAATLQHENRKTKTQKTAPKRYFLLSVSAKKERLYHKGVARGTRGQAGSETSTSHGTGPRKARLGGSLALALAGPPVSPPYAGSRSCQRKAFTDPSCKPQSPAPTPTRPSVLAACRALGADVSHRTALDLLWISPLRANASSKPHQPGEGTVPAVVTRPGTVGRKAFPCFCCPKCNGRNVPVFPISGETEPLKHS